MVRMLFEIGIEGRTLTDGECVTLSRSLEHYLVDEGVAVYKTAAIDFTILEQREHINNDTDSGSGQLPDKHRGKTVFKGRPKRK